MEYLKFITKVSATFADTFWGMWLIIIILGCGVYFSLYLKIPQVRFFYHALRVMVGKYIGPRQKIKEELSGFRAFCNAISTPIGLGSIAGVAIAISVGGPGTVFWMWIAGIIGMSTKLVSITLSLLYHQESQKENIINKIGPMYTIVHGLGKKYFPLAIIFSVITVMVSLTAGSLFQSNQMAHMLSYSFGIPNYISGIIIAAIATFSLIHNKGVIAEFVSRVAPFIIITFTLGTSWIIFNNWGEVLGIIGTIINSAFEIKAGTGAVFGLASKEIIIYGMRRALFSNEAGMGSAAMARRNSYSNPVQEGILGMLGPFIDTIIVSTITALIILMTNAWKPGSGIQGIELAAEAFTITFGVYGKFFITIFVLLFAYSTILSWAYIGQKAFFFFISNNLRHVYKYVYVLFVFLGTILTLEVIVKGRFNQVFLSPVTFFAIFKNNLTEVSYSSNIPTNKNCFK